MSISLVYVFLRLYQMKYVEKRRRDYLTKSHRITIQGEKKLINQRGRTNIVSSP